MTGYFTFQPHPSLQTVENVLLHTREGQAAVYEVATNFASLTDALHHTQAIGHSSVVHVPNGDTIGFVNVPKRELAAAAFQIGAALGLNIT